jgi:hypothetical protein
MLRKRRSFEVPMSYVRTSYDYDMNIEFAHVFPKQPQAELSFQKSFRLLCDYMSVCESKRETFSLSILIDDKQSDAKHTYEWIVSHLNDQGFDRFENLYWGIESELKHYRNALYEALLVERKPQISRNIEAYLLKHGKLGCTHDIAIWNLLRLGVISPFDSLAIRYQNISQKLSGRQATAFAARRIASILSEADFRFEERADTEILQYVRSNDHLLGRTDKLFYSLGQAGVHDEQDSSD